MDTNGNQRKRTGSRLNKNNNDGSMGPPQPVSFEDNEVMEVAALAISPTSEADSLNINTPAAECRRSSRKKIIKFDVRDLLNKNRKPHKIQIEARIDSNAPTTSKAFAATAGETSGNSSSSGLGDLSSKQKTFLEKSAIFRRYSISQEPKPPPPPLPLPPSLLGKGNDNKDLSSSDITTTRRLSRTQEFFSNVMIKPKQTTSLIVAQMESSAPSQMGKRKSFNKSMEIQTKLPESINTPLAITTLQKKRGRPSKIKMKTTEESSTKEDENIKKITPEKAKNWKEYKACLAQQSSDKEKSKSSEALTADVGLEISSTSSSHSSHIEVSKEKEELEIKSLEKKQQLEKNQEVSVKNFNLFAEIVTADSNLKESSLKTTLADVKNIEISQESTTDPINDNEFLSKIVETTSTQQLTKKDQTNVALEKNKINLLHNVDLEKDKLEVALEQDKYNLEVSLEKDKDKLVVSLEKDTNKLEVSFEKGSITKRLSHTEDIEKVDKTSKDLQQPSKDEELIEKVSNTPQPIIKETTRNRRQIKLAGTVPKQTDSKGKKSPTNIDASLQQETDLKADQSKQEEFNKKDCFAKDNEIAKENVFKKTNIDASLLKEVDSKDNTKCMTVLDSFKQKENFKDTEDAKVVAEKNEQTEADNTTIQDITEKNQTKLDENLQKDVKGDQSPKIMAITRRSRSKIYDSIAKEIHPKASTSTKEQKSVKRNQTKLKDFIQTAADTQILKSFTEQADTLQKDIDITAEQGLSDILQIDSLKAPAINSSCLSTFEDSSQKETFSEISDKSNIKLKTAKKNQNKPNDSLEKNTKSEDSSTEDTRSRRSQFKLDDSRQNEKFTKTSEAKQEQPKTKIISEIKLENSLQKVIDSEASQSNKETELDTKTSQSTKLEDSLQKVIDSKSTQSNNEQELDTKTLQSTKENLDDSLQNQTETSQTNKQLKAGKRGQTKLDDSLQKNADSEDNQSEKEQELDTKTLQPTKENLDDSLQNQTETSQTNKQLKAGKRGQTKLDDSLQKNADSEDNQSNIEQELVTQPSQSTEENPNDSVQNKNQTKTSRTIKQKGEKRGQTKVEDSLQKATESEAQEEEKDSITLQSTKEEQEAESETTNSFNKIKLTKIEANVHKVTDSKDSQSNKDEIHSKKSQPWKVEESLTTSPGNKRKLTKKEENAIKDGKDTEVGGVSSKLDNYFQNENLSETNKEVKAKKKGRTKLNDSLQKDEKSEISQTDNKVIDTETSQSTKEETGNSRKLIKKETTSQKEIKDDCLMTDTDFEATQSKKEDKRRRKTPSKLDDFIRNENTTQTHAELKTRKKDQTIQLTDSLQNVTDSKTSQSSEDEIDSKTSQTTTEDTDNKKKLTEDESSPQKESNDGKLLEDIDTEQSISPKEDKKCRRSRSKLEDHIHNETISTISQSTKEKERTTTPSNEEKFAKKETPTPEEDKTKDFTAKGSDNIKILDEKSDKEQQQRDNNKKLTSRNKRNLKKLEQSIQKEEEEDTQLTKSTEKTNIDDTQTLSSSQRMVLKSPEPTANTEQIEQENTSTLEISIKDSTFSQESSLSQSSTPSEEKSLTFSRTSSSSESENVSERSSFSSATSSTSSSGRSYKSGDKLRVSLKRISLPNSPSTSSQNSTSEEGQYYPDMSLNINKKKPPIAKRSKRLQKKSLDNQDSREHIDDCFQKISTDEREATEITNKDIDTTDSLQESQSNDENKGKVLGEELSTEISSLKSREKNKDVETLLAQTPQTRNKKVNIIQEPNEQIKVDENIANFKVKQQNEEVVEEESTKMLSKPQDEEAMKDLEKPATSKGQRGTDVATMVKRKSLRIRKDDSEEKEQQNKESTHESTEENSIQQSQEKQTVPEMESIEKGKETEIKYIEKLDEPKQQAKKNLIEQEETLTETKQQKQSQVKDNPKHQVEHEKKEESGKEKLENKTTQTKQQKKKKEQEERTTEQELQVKEIIEEQEANTQEKYNIETEIGIMVNTTNKPVRGKKSSKALTLVSDSFENNESQEQSPKSITKLDEPKIEPSPKIIKSGKETISAEKLFDKDQNNKSSTDIKENTATKSNTARSKTGKISPVETKVAEPSKFTLTRSKTGKTSPNQVVESPKTLKKSNEGSTTPAVEDAEKESPKSYSSEQLFDINLSNKSGTDIKETETTKFTRSRTGKTSPVEAVNSDGTEKISPVETKVDEPSQFTLTRSKTSPNQAMESPKTLKKSSEESTTPAIEAAEKESPKSYSSEQLFDINLSNKSGTDIKETETTKFTRSRTGKTSPVEAVNSDATENKYLKSYSKKSKQKISLSGSPKMSTEETVQNDVDIIEKESAKGSRKITKKDMLTEKVEEKKSAIEITQKEFINTSSKESSTITATEELASIEIQETSSLPLEDIKQPLIDINEQESLKSFAKKSKAEIDSTTLSLTILGDSDLQSPKFTSSTKSKPDIERPSSAKRKSLRNQRDKHFDDSTSSSLETCEQDKVNKTTNEMREESISSLEIMKIDIEKEKLDITPKVISEETIKVPKKRGRKPRFKNLHGPETESETEGSTGKQTPIDEALMYKRTYDLTPPPIEQTPKPKDKDVNKDMDLDEKNLKESSVIEDLKVKTPKANSKIISEEKDDIINRNHKEKSQSDQDTTKTSLVSEKSERPLLNQTVNSETYSIKNVSIETNTLLDILRTVQSNTAAAALEANRKCDNKTEEIPATTKHLTHTQISITKSYDMPSTSQDRSLLSLKSLKQLDEDSNTNSPTRSDTASPLTLKKVAISPTRSDSSSPLTLIKVGQSPTRSETSSPLTLKKVTRRYERRSRRGDDSAHKTLEETFAEIAAQSCKAVLAAKSFDINDEFITREIYEDKLEMDTEKLRTKEDVNEQKLSEKVENIEKNLHKVPDIKNSSSEVSKKTHDTEISPLEASTKSELETTTELSTDKPSIQTTLETSEFSVSEKQLETPESSKVTPVKRGRKPKNRIIEVLSPITKDGINEKDKDDKNSPKIKKDIENSRGTLQAKDPQQLSSSKDSLTESSIKITEESIETQESIKETAKNKDISETTKDPAKIIEIAKDEENKQPDYCTESSVPTETQETSLKSPEYDSKPPKKLNKKRDATKELPITAEDDNTKQEDDIRTPKQTTKKRESSLSKSETKSIGKKSTKKSKNNEDSTNLQKVDNTPKTTTPPPKRGRKPKNQQDPQQPTSSSKKKNTKETLNESNDDENLGEKRKDLESESESLNSSLDKSLDEKIAKKKRQKKLKEAFEAALTVDLNKNNETINSNANSSSCFGLTLLNKSPPPERRDSFLSESIRNSCITPVEPEEDPDPLKDIEKFIADGVNLLKKDYKLDEDSVDDVLTTKTSEIVETTPINDDKPVFNTFETPADTPITTPSVTPPPKSPTSVESTTPDENSGVRRSHRIKLITQTPKALVGRGLVRDKERFSIKDDVETKSHYTLDDHLMDLAEVEAKNAKFLKEMEERLSNFQVIKENDYLCERVISREARKMICDCFLTHEEEERGELGCGEDCLNRLLMIECGFECNVKERCTNKRFQKLLCSPCRVFRTEKKGFGIMADIEILPGEFIMEYVGEVIDTEIFEQRRIMYSQDKNRHYYFMALRSDAIIDATIKGNISRFINHSCDPNAETQKWTVNGELRIGFFSRKSIMPGEEITFNYQYQRYGKEAQRCYCESSNCRGWIGPEPTSDEGEQIDDDEDESEYDDDELEEEEGTKVSATLLEQDDDDDEDSDTSVVDPEEVQKKLEMAAAQAEVELAPIPNLEETAKEEVSITTENKENDDLTKSETAEEDSKSKFKKLLSIMAEKVAAKQKQNKREQKLQRKKKSKESSSELANKLRFLEDPDIEDEVEFLRECGLKNQSDTLRLSRLMVRAKLVQTRLNLLDILRKGDLPCRRLFLDYHGLRLVHGWMSEDAGNMQIRMALLQTLETLPIANKTVLTDSKVMQMVRNWCGSQTPLSPNDDSSSSNSNSQDVSLSANANLEECSDLQELQKLALKLITTWEGLPEIFRIPKKERIEQMKEHEREADRQYAANAEKDENKTLTNRYRRDRFGKGLSSTTWATTTSTSNRFLKPNNGNPLRNSNNTTATTPKSNENLSKAQRREMFAAKVARDEAEKRMAEERREFETKCRFFGLDPKKTRPQDVPFCVNPATGQWYSIDRKPITTPPSYAHVQVPLKSKSTDPNDYQLPAVCNNLPPQWKYAITPLGKIYYYHIKYRLPQWEPPTLAQLQQCEMEAEEEADSESELAATAGEDSSEDDDEILIGMDAVQLRTYMYRKVESRRQKRYQRLVDQRPISPRREEDRIYNQIEVRKYKDNKEKIRKRKEEIRRKRAEALRQSSLNMCTLGSITETNLTAIKIQTESDEELGVLPIQDYLLSSDEEIDLKAEINSPLIDKIVEGDKIVDELDALTSKRQLKRPLPPHRDLSEPSTSTAAATSAVTTTIDRQEYKKRKLEKKEKRKPKDQDAKYRKNKEKFRCEIAGIIVHHLKPYRRDTCTIGRIQSNEDFNHLARKLTHFVMIKELKYCESVGQTLVVTESVKNKSREFIKKYMAKYKDVYIKPSNDPDFKDIPFKL